MRIIVSATIIVFLLAALVVSGCGVERQFRARDASLRYQQSSEAYRSCLAANASNIRACEAQRLTMETDEHEYNTLRTNPGETQNINVNTRNR
jgi:hypothetical protein